MRVNKFTAIADMMLVMEELGSPLKRMTFCITGHLGRPRKEIEEIIRMAGGRTESSVKYGVTHVLTNADWTAGSLGDGVKVSTKYMKAKQFGCKILSEEKFYALFTGSDS